MLPGQTIQLSSPPSLLPPHCTRPLSFQLIKWFTIHRLSLRDWWGKQPPNKARESREECSCVYNNKRSMGQEGVTAASNQHKCPKRDLQPSTIEKATHKDWVQWSFSRAVGDMIITGEQPSFKHTHTRFLPWIGLHLLLIFHVVKACVHTFSTREWLSTHTVTISSKSPLRAKTLKRHVTTTRWHTQLVKKIASYRFPVEPHWWQAHV